MYNNDPIIGLTRKKVADLCLRSSDTELAQRYRGELGKTFRFLLTRLLVEKPASGNKTAYAGKLRTQLIKKNKNMERIGVLLAAMLYHRAYNLGMMPDIHRIPKWFLNDYLAYMSNPTLLFFDPGETDRYCTHMQKWVGSLHASIISNTEPGYWYDIATRFIELADFGPLYFTTRNLKRLYQLRGEIIEHILQNNTEQLNITFPGRPQDRSEIRIGVLANHFSSHPETFATLPLYEHLDKQFHTTLYTLHKTGNEMEIYCASRARELKQLPDTLSEQVKMVRQDDLDILFVATNITAVVNPICKLATFRLARKQLTSVGSVTTTGLSNMDYYLTGRLTDNETSSVQYTETPLWLPETAHCFSYGQRGLTSSAPVTRSQLCIDESALVYASGANVFKISPNLIKVWGRILQAVPDSVLMLYPYGPNWSNNYPKEIFIQHLHAILKRQRINKNRILVLDPKPAPDREGIREYLKNANVYLDSFPFSGTTSFIEPLEIALPITSMQGQNFRSTMGAALLKALSLDELVANSEAEYIEIAVRLGNDAGYRSQLNTRIREAMKCRPSFLDSVEYSSQAGKLLRDILSDSP